MMFITEDLITKFKIEANLPDNSKVLTDTQIIDLLNQEMLDTIVPLMLSLKANYFTKEVDLQPTRTNLYKIPVRAYGSTVKDVFKKDGQGRGYIAEVREDEVGSLRLTGANGISMFFVRGGYLHPLPGPNGALTVTFPLKPNKLVKSTSVVVITAVNANTKTVSFASKPGTYLDTSKYDLVSAANGSRIEFDLTVDSSDSTSITFNEDIGDVEVGDYLCLANQSPIANIPEEVQPLLILNTVIKFFENQPDTEALKVVQGKQEKLQINILKTMSDRVEDKAVILRPNPRKWR